MPNAAKTDEPKPMFWATVVYKLWVRDRMKEKGWSLNDLVDEIKKVDRRANASSGGLSQFLGPEDETPKPSNTTLMPAINKVFGAPPPPVCDPTNPILQLRDGIAARWESLTDTERKMLLVLVGAGE